MTHRERIRAILNREPVDRIPVDLWYTDEVAQSLMAHFGVNNAMDLHRAMDIDKTIWVFPGPIESEDVTATPDAPALMTVWGTSVKRVDTGVAVYYEMDQRPLSHCSHPDDIARYTSWPDPERFDYEKAAELACEASKEFATLGPWVSFFEIYCQMRGIEQAVTDVLIMPELVEAALNKIEQIQTGILKRFLDRAARFMDMVFVSDDMGNQTNLTFPLSTWDRFFPERLARWCSLIHSYGVKVLYHSDGAVEPLVPRLIECGIDVLNPIQHVCNGMNMGLLKRRYGNHLIFHGGVDNQSVLPFGTPDDVREETRRCLKTLGRDRAGFICCSCHNIQAGTPVENILAMVDTVKAESAVM